MAGLLASAAIFGINATLIHSRAMAGYVRRPQPPIATDCHHSISVLQPIVRLMKNRRSTDINFASFVFQVACRLVSFGYSPPVVVLVYARHESSFLRGSCHLNLIATFNFIGRSIGLIDGCGFVLLLKLFGGCEKRLTKMILEFVVSLNRDSCDSLARVDRRVYANSWKIINRIIRSSRFSETF